MAITKMPDGSYKAIYGGKTRIFKTLKKAKEWKEWAAKFKSNPHKKKSSKISY